MNLLDILENNMLLEAVRINSGKEAVNLISSNQIGVKIDPSYKNRDLSSLEPVFNNVINRVGINNAVFAVQLLVNKVPFGNLNKAVSSDSFLEIVKCRNKPWAKQIPGFMDAVSLSSKTKYDENTWHRLEKALQEEGQKHGKLNKGSGNIKDVKILYPLDTNGWVLYQPTSWEGAKAVSFYINSNGIKTPTEWCTRADKRYYDHYTENNTKPLYIIRNDKLHKAYQMAVRKDQVDFLDQNDFKGDEVVKGDLNGLPENLLNKINIGKGTLVDYRNDYNKNYNNKEAEKSVKDYNDKNAKWSKKELVHTNPNIYRQVCINFVQNKKDPFDLYNSSGTTKQKKSRTIIKYKIEVKGADDLYYFSDTKFGDYEYPWAKKDHEGKFIAIDKKFLHDNYPERTKRNNFNYSDLMNFENNLFNKEYKKGENRKLNKSQESYTYNQLSTSNIIDDAVRDDQQLEDSINMVFDKYGYDSRVVYISSMSGEGPNPGSIFPKEISIELRVKHKDSYTPKPVIYVFYRKGNKYARKEISGDGISYLSASDKNEIDQKLENVISAEVSRISKNLINNKELSELRMQRRAHTDNAGREKLTGTKRAMFENYFPY